MNFIRKFFAKRMRAAALAKSQREANKAAEIEKQKATLREHYGKLKIALANVGFSTIDWLVFDNDGIGQFHFCKGKKIYGAKVSVKGGFIVYEI